MTSGCRASPPGRRSYRILLEYALSAMPGSSMRDFTSQHRGNLSLILGKMVRFRVDDNRRLTIRRMEDPTSFRGHTRNSLQLRAN